MAKIAGKLTDLIGNTPLLELSNYNNAYKLNAKLIEIKYLIRAVA